MASFEEQFPDLYVASAGNLNKTAKVCFSDDVERQLISKQRVRAVLEEYWDNDERMTLAKRS